MDLVSISLLPPEFRHLEAVHRKQRKWLLLLAVVVLLLLAALAAVTVNVQLAERQQESLLAYRELLDGRLQGLVEYEEVFDRLSRLNKVKQEITAATVAWPEVLVELGRATPEGVWLTDFRGITRYTGDEGAFQTEIVLRGEALDHLSVGRYLDQLRRLSMLSDVKCHFSLGDNSGPVQFEVTALVGGPGQDLF